MRNHKRPPWDVARSSFFGRALSANLGPDRAIPIPQRSSISRSQLLTRRIPTTWANHQNLPPPNNAFQILQLDMTPITRHVSSPVGGRTAQFVENWMKLSQDPWIHSTNTGYQLPLQCCPKRNHSTANLKEDQRLILHSEIHKLVEKGCSTNKAITSLHNKPYVCGLQKRRRLEANHRPEIPQFLPRATTGEDGGSLCYTTTLI